MIEHTNLFLAAEQKPPRAGNTSRNKHLVTGAIMRINNLFATRVTGNRQRPGPRAVTLPNL